jgi:glycosyltransferase involved in cell wall biosynthesis
MAKLSIITVNYNNALGLQKTIESVHNQNFYSCDQIVIDGNSYDGSKDVIEKYSDKLAYCVSEVDNGVYSAMNKGIKFAQGEYILFLNSGDIFYSENSLKILFENIGTDIVYGNILVDSMQNAWVKLYPSILTFDYFLKDTLPHPATLIKRSLFEKIGLYNEHNKIVSDWEFFTNAICLHGATYKYVNEIISIFNYDGMSSRIENQYLVKEEKDKVLQNYYGAFLPDYEKLQSFKTGVLLEKKQNRIRLRLNSLFNRLFQFIK